MGKSDAFQRLFLRYLNERGTTAGRVALAIGLSRAAVYAWRDGTHLPAPQHRDKVLACARFFRLTPGETNKFLRAAGMEEEYPLEGSSPQGNQRGFISRLFEALAAERGAPLLLLTRTGWGEPPFRASILEHAETVYGRDRVLELQPPCAASGDQAFGALTRSGGLPGVGDAFDFEQALEQRLRAGTLFVLVSRFEQGDPGLQESLAGILRSLCEIHSPRLHLVLCGGERLAGLKYQSGDLSLLNIAEVLPWPELVPDDVPALYGGSYPRLGLSREEVTRVLEVSGGDPQLLGACLRLITLEPGLGLDTLPQRLADHEVLWARFTPLVGTAEDRTRLRSLLQRERVAEAHPFLMDPVLRGLYWRNLVRERVGGGRRWLHWLCDAVRLAGERVLAAVPAASGEGDGAQGP